MYKGWKKMLARLYSIYIAPILKKETGATAVEYAVMVALIAASIIVTVILLRDQIVAIFTYIADQLKAVLGG
jgi:Flp pilus assembly pilin Flp